MSEFTDKIAAMEAVLAASTVFDRFVMDEAFRQLSGLDLRKIDPKLRNKLEKTLARLNDMSDHYPEAADPTKPLPATALVTCASIMEAVRNLAK